MLYAFKIPGGLSNLPGRMGGTPCRVPRKPQTRIGDGTPAVVLAEVRKDFPGLVVTYRGDDIRQPTDWRIHEDSHSIVVHLGGHMDWLETELDGSGGSTGSALPGEIWTVPARRRYASHACGRSIEYAALQLDPLDEGLATDNAPALHDIVPVAGMRDDFLHHATRQLVLTMQARDDVSSMLAESLSQTIRLHVLRSYAPGGPARGIDSLRAKDRGPILTQSQCRRLRDHIIARLDERLTLRDLATLVGLTTHHFLIAFRKAFGSTPMAYIIQQRIRQVQRLLLHSRKDITSIALESGFSSHSHLTACFSKLVGCSPKVFRESARRFQIPVWRK